jgi:hypothetical protein
MNYELGAKVISYLYKRKKVELLTVRAISKIINEPYTSTRRTILQLEQKDTILLSKIGEYNVVTIIKSPKLLPFLILSETNPNKIIQTTKKLCEELK